MKAPLFYPTTTVPLPHSGWALLQYGGWCSRGGKNHLPLARRLTALDESRYNPAAVENGACRKTVGRPPGTLYGSNG